MGSVILYMSNICGTLCLSVFMSLLGGLCGIVDLTAYTATGM